MSSNKIVFSDQDAGLGQVGGGAFLPDMALWPRAPDSGELLTPLMTLTERFLPVTFIPEGMALTVFIAVKQRDGEFNEATQRRYTVNQQSELETVRNAGYARVLLHRLSDQPLSPTPGTLLLPSAFIHFQAMSDEELEQELEDDDNGLEVSKPVGRPSWLQDPIYEPNRYLFLLQLRDYDIAQWSPEHEGLLAEGIGYVYVDRQARRGKEGDEGGYFFLQST
ncbi:hypothetical protein [Pseudomonas cremoricolorata]|uniref:DUF1963 domain-containing protein n=1 Tax=Pseudomonas cremoricolorata TaxID=157783 RepID=A0A089WJ45_9PSED|nr:hypothetical protein [Pseudomonas cremoricolorata]AIR88616.1 hypothetical protein LK03_04800 [Pseudomonas cremoricolorata]